MLLQLAGGLGTGMQTPGVVSVQLIQTASQSMLQQTPSIEQKPLAHSSVVTQVVPGFFFVWQAKVPSQ